MELIKQVCSLELGRKLQKLTDKKGIFGFYHDREHWAGNQIAPASNLQVHRYIGETDLQFPSEYLAPAFTVAELGEMLCQYSQMPFYDDGEWKSDGYYDLITGRERITEDTEANCRAMCLIENLERKLGAASEPEQPQAPTSSQ